MARKTHLLTEDERDLPLSCQVALLDAHERVVLLALAEGGRVHVSREVAEGRENARIECALPLVVSQSPSYTHAERLSVS